ncbi:MAG: hypothetical protein ACLFRI_06205 [Candidatus Izemoplasmataceae bacterium]
MHCLNNMRYVKIPNDVIKLYLNIYPFIGRNQDMLQSVKNDYDVLVAETIRSDAYFLSRMLNLKIKDSRYKSLLTKDVQAKTKDEQLLKNIVKAFEKIHKSTDTFSLYVSEIYDLLKFIYKDVDDEKTLYYAKTEKKKDDVKSLLSSAYPTKRESLEALIKDFLTLKKQDDYEISLLIINFYIDFINLKPFTKHNDVIGLLLLYILLITNQYQSLHLSSLFELFHKQSTKFNKYILDASQNWSTGLADTIPLHRFLLELLLESYKQLHELLRNYTFDQQTNKSDYIENTINKLEEVFTKEDIRLKHPTISDSTINRTLKRLRDEKKIRPLGKGRSAKWMKLYPTNKKAVYDQLKLKV